MAGLGRASWGVLLLLLVLVSHGFFVRLAQKHYDVDFVSSITPLNYRRIMLDFDTTRLLRVLNRPKSKIMFNTFVMKLIRLQVSYSSSIIQRGLQRAHI